jgi:hypothetical protein
VAGRTFASCFPCSFLPSIITVIMPSAATVISELSSLPRQLAATPTLTLTQWEMAPGAQLAQWAAVPHPEWVPDAVRDCLNQANGLLLAWDSQAQRPPDDEEAGFPLLSGSAEVLGVAAIYQDWKDFVYFDFDDLRRYGWRQTFKLADMIRYGAPAAVGLFHTAARNPQLYYYTFEGEPHALGVDLPGYLELLRCSWGGAGWQQVLLELLHLPQRPYVPASPETEDYAAAMQLLDPGFDLQALAACYDRVRLPAEVIHQPPYVVPAEEPAAAPAAVAAIHYGGPAFQSEAPRAASLIEPLHQQLAAIPGITVKEWKEEPGATDTEWSTVSHPEWVPMSLRELSYQCTMLAFRWHTGLPGSNQLPGRAVLVCSPEAFTDNWLGTMYNIDQSPTEEDAWRWEFIPLDLASTNIIVGIYYTAQSDQQLYVYKRRTTNRPLPLSLDVWGYLELLRYSWGGTNWQLVLLEAAANAQRPYVPASPETQAYAVGMQQFAPAFDLQALVACYDRVRLPG